MWFVMSTSTEMFNPVVEWRLVSRVEGIKQEHDAQSELEALESTDSKHRFFLIQMDTPVVWPK